MVAFRLCYRKAMIPRVILVACLLPLTAFAASAPVKIAGDDASFTISNAQLTAVISKKHRRSDFAQVSQSGNDGPLVPGTPPAIGSRTPATPRRSFPQLPSTPHPMAGERGEVSIKGISDGKPLGGGGPGGGMLCDLEIRYALGRDDSGIYTYAIFSHPLPTRATQVGESRFGAKLNGASLRLAFHRRPAQQAHAHRRRLGSGSPLNMKEARRLTTGIY